MKELSAVSIPDRYNASVLLDGNLEAGRGEKIAVRMFDESITFKELFDRMCASALALQELGIERGDRVLMVMDDGPSFPAIFLGAIRIGAVPVPLNPMYGAHEYEHFVVDSEAQILVADGPRARALVEGLDGLTGRIRVTAVGDGGESVSSFDELVGACSGDIAPADTASDDTAFWLYSSGSTGKPKGVVHRQGDILYTCETYAKHVLNLTEEDVTFSSTKLFHAYGLGNSLSFPYWAGASTVLHAGRPTPDALFETIEAFEPTVFFSVPTLYNAMLHTEGGDARNLSTIRTCVSAAEPLPAEVWNRWQHTYGLEILDGIGSTEMLHIYCSNGVDGLKPGSSGKAVPGYGLVIRDGEGTETETGQAGDLYVTGSSMLACYWNQLEKTAGSIRDGWFSTGDRYKKDEEGFYYFEGRADDMFKVQGLWVSPAEVESAMIEHPSVREVAVIGVIVEGFVQGKAFVVPDPSVSLGDALKNDLIRFCGERMHKYQAPRSVEFVEDLPKTMTGKIQRYKLRDLR